MEYYENIDVYTGYVSNTIERFNKKIQREIIRKLKSDNAIFETDDILGYSDGDVALNKLSEPDNLLKAIVEAGNLKVLNSIEEYEYIASYTYSAIYEINAWDKKAILDKLNSIGLSKQNFDGSSFEILNQSIDNPYYYLNPDCDDKIFFKFPIPRMNGALGQDNREYKYVVLAIIDVSLSILEIRFDRFAPGDNSTSSSVYSDLCDKVRAFFSKLGIVTYPFDLYDVIKDIKDNGSAKDVSVSFRRDNGGEATLDKSKGDKYPILDELKNLLVENESIFLESPKCESLIRDFIHEIEENSEYRSITLAWNLTNFKKDTNKVKFTFDYIEDDTSLIFYYAGLTGMERMNYVTKELAETYSKLKNNNSGE